jgi:hypothetical protein
MISDYIHPQQFLRQLLQITSAPSVTRLTPVVVGPAYKLSRYDIDAVLGTTFDASQHQLSYTYGSAGVVVGDDYTIDTDFTKLFGKSLEATLATFNTQFKVKSSSETNTLVLDGSVVLGAGLNAAFYGRPVSVGDIAYVTSGGKTYRRTVTGLRGRTIAAVFGSNTDADNTLSAPSPYNPANRAEAVSTILVTPDDRVLDVSTDTTFQGALQGALVNNAFGDIFTLEVTVAGAPGVAEVSVTSRSGLYSGTLVSTDDNGDFVFADATGDVMGGLTVTVTSEANAPLVQGEVYSFSHYAAYTALVVTGNNKNVEVALADGETSHSCEVDTTYSVEVLTGTYDEVTPSATGAVLRITDTAGIDAAATVTLTDGVAFPLGTSGLEMSITLGTGTFPQGGLRKGDVYTVKCKAASESTTVFDKVVLSGPAVDATVFTDYTATVNVEFRVAYSGAITSGWTAAADAVTVAAGLSMNMPTRSVGHTSIPFVDGVGELYLTWRALAPAAATDDKILIEDELDIVNAFGPISLDNPTAFAASRALAGAQGKKIYGKLTAGTSLEAFTDSMHALMNTKAVYHIVAVTDLQSVHDMVAAHCTAASSETKRRFRRTYIGVDSPGSYPVLQTYNNLPVTCTIGIHNGAYVMATIATEGVSLDDLDITAGDRLLLTTLGTEYEILSASGNEVILRSGPAGPISNTTVEIWKADTPESQAAYLISKAKALSNRRAVLVWCEGGKRLVDGLLTSISSKYIAAEIAGVRAATPSQLGITRLEVETVTQAYPMYMRYSDELLDEIAANGILIVTQDAESGKVYIRHQLTTDTDHGALYYEDSIGVNTDFVCFQIDDIVDRYIGKKNLTPQTEGDLTDDVYTLLNGFTKADESDPAGPVLQYFKDLKFTPNAVLKDRGKLTVTLGMGLPFNIVETEVSVEQANQ